MPEPSDAKRIAQAITIISDIRKVALTTFLKMTEDQDTASNETKATLAAHFKHLTTVFPELVTSSNLGRHMHFAMRQDFSDILLNDLPAVEGALLKWAQALPERPSQSYGFEDLLHPRIVKHSLPLYADHHHTEAVRNAYSTVFEEIRRRTKRTDDGSNLVNAVFGLSKPLLVVGDLATETGQNAQKGLLSLLQGVLQAFRNPLAHSGPATMRVSPEQAARHMILASLLLNRVDNGRPPEA